jgi:O-methyltransferase
MKFSSGNQDFSDTNIDLVLGKMKYPENCIVKKGYFPSTAVDIDEKFAFVSIDVDLYEPILKGLEYFYPRLREKGYIFVYDYNNNGYPGSKEVVRKFCSKNHKSYVPISDCCGSIIITK